MFLNLLKPLEYPIQFFFDYVNYALLLPEITLVVGLCIMIFAGLLNKDSRVLSFWLFLITLIITALNVLGVYSFSLNSVINQNTLMSGNHFHINSMISVLKLSLIIMFALIAMYNMPHLRKTDQLQSEYFYLSTIMLLGSFIAISSTNFIMLYLGIELSALATYALVAMNRNHQAVEAALKYFILGAILSAIMLFGISLIYGMTGAVDYSSIVQSISNSSTNNLLIIIGCMLFLIGIFFKFGAAPFHTWMPDVYTGASLPVVQIIASISKLVAFGIIVNLSAILFTLTANHHSPVMIVFYFIAIICLLWGNIAALLQDNLKKMLAYSAIGNVGFVLLALSSQYDLNALFHFLLTSNLQLKTPILFKIEYSSHMPDGLNSMLDHFLNALFYITIYAITALAFFGTLLGLRHPDHQWKVSHLNGLGQKHPWIASALTILVISMMGLPPTLGFYAKFIVFLTLIQKSQFTLLFIAIFASIIAVFYYLRLLKSIWFEPVNEHATIEKLPIFLTIVISAFLLFGFIILQDVFTF